MSVQSEITRIDNAIASTYSALEEQGATLPSTDNQTSYNLAATVATIPTAGRVVTTSGSSTAYTATVSGITSLTAGVSFIMIPHTSSTSKTPTLNVNDLGAKYLKQPLTTNTSTNTTPTTTSWLVSGKPVRVMYDGSNWEIDIPRPDASTLYGTVPVANGGVPTCSTSDEGKFLRVVSGVATWSTISNAEEGSF